MVIIYSKYTPAEAQLSMCVDLAYRERSTWDGNSQTITQNIERGCACFQEKYYMYVLLYRAAVHESVCEYSHTCSLQASAAVSTSIAEVVL